MIFPVKEKFRITQGYKSTHDAIDVAPEVPGKRGVKLYSPEAGTVVRSRYSRHNPSWPLDNWVIIKGDQTKEYYYLGHMESRAVSEGQRVAEGQLIGIMGTTGKSTGIHTHIEVRYTQAGTGHDPIAHFKSNGIDVATEAKTDRENVTDGKYKGKTAQEWYELATKHNATALVYKGQRDELRDRAEAHQNTINELKAALANEKNKPPVEVIKEVEVIVEKPVTVPAEIDPKDPSFWHRLVSAIINLFRKDKS